MGFLGGLGRHEEMTLEEIGDLSGKYLVLTYRKALDLARKEARKGLMFLKKHHRDEYDAIMRRNRNDEDEAVVAMVDEEGLGEWIAWDQQVIHVVGQREPMYAFLQPPKR